MAGTRRPAFAGPQRPKTQKVIVTERLRAVDARLAENEARTASWLAAAGQDIVSLRQMLAAAIEAMEAHDTTIAAMRRVISAHVPDGDAQIDREREALLRLKDTTQRKNEEVAAEWNRQLRAMEAEGVPPETLREIFALSRRTMTAPEICRLQVTQGDAPEVPAGAFEFRIT